MSTGFISKVNAQNGWVQMASMDEAKGGSQSCVIDSLIYVIGGVNNAVSTLNTTEFYNTETDEWEAKKKIFQ